jgi:hypothetical protein
MGEIIDARRIKHARESARKLAQSGVQPMTEADLMAIEKTKRLAYQIDEVATMLGVSVHFMRKQIVQGDLVAVAVSPKLYLLTPEAIQAWWTAKGGGKLEL